jgi:hypothetical protein
MNLVGAITPDVHVSLAGDYGDGLRAGNLRAFRTYRPEEENFVVCQDVDRASVREVNGVRVTFENLHGLVRRLTPPRRVRRLRGRR